MRAHDEFGFICIFSKKGNTEALCKKCACLFSVLYREYQYTFFHNSATYILIKEIKVGRHHTCILKTNLQDIIQYLAIDPAYILRAQSFSVYYCYMCPKENFWLG